MLRDISQQVEWYGRKLDDESWKHIFSAAVQQQDAVPGINGGFVVSAYRPQAVKEVVQRNVPGDGVLAAERGVKFTTRDYWEAA